MRNVRWLLSTILIVWPLSAMAAEEGPHWEANLDQAKRVAAQTNRLVLVHFWAPWCGPCKRLETTVFGQPGVGRAIDARFVPVKINADEFPATARNNFEIERLPTDVIMTPDGKILCKLGCPQDPQQYLAQLDQATSRAMNVAAAGPPANQNLAVQAPTVPLAATANPYRPNGAGPDAGALASDGPSAAVAGPTNRVATATKPVAETPGLSIYSQNNAGYVRRDAPGVQPAANNMPPPSNPAFAQATPQPRNELSPNMVPVGGSPTLVPNRGSSPPAQFVSAQQSLPPNVNPVGLDGFCPVTLIERSRTAPEDPRCWVRGDPRWGAVHRGITYLFNGAEEQKRFLANPDFYAPALSGNDAVLAFDRGRLIRGRREFGTFCDGRIYLFASKETLESFQKDYQRFIDEVRQAENPQHAAVR